MQYVRAMSRTLGMLVKHGILNIFNKYITNSAKNWNTLYSENYSIKMDCLDQRPRHYLMKGIVEDLGFENPRVLDIGCGTGSTYATLMGSPMRYKGIDLSSTAIAECRKRYPSSENCIFEVQDLKSMTSRTQYDVVIANEVFYYLKIEEIQGVLESIKKLLKTPSSLLLVSMSNSAKSKRVWPVLQKELGKPIHNYHLGGAYSSSEWTIRSFAHRGAAPKLILISNTVLAKRAVSRQP